MDDLQPTNVKVQLLPPNTTAKVQPMDAGIITGLKGHRRYHLQHALDCNERGEIGNIYKVDQLTPMRWSPSSRTCNSARTIKNFFDHTIIFAITTAGLYQVRKLRTWR